MTEEHARRVGGKGFAPSERNVDEHEDESNTTVHGGGKQFAKDVGDPDTDDVARQTEGSGKQFAWDRESEPDETEPDETEPDETELPDDAASGSGKQFRPGPDGR